MLTHNLRHRKNAAEGKMKNGEKSPKFRVVYVYDHAPSDHLDP